MKKFLSLLLVLFMAFSLGACGESKGENSIPSEQKVTIKDSEGKDVEVVLKPSEEKDVVKNALVYASQAEYENVEHVVLDVQGSGKIAAAKNYYYEASANLNLGADFDSAEETLAAYGEAGFSLNAKLPGVDQNGQATIDSHSMAVSGHAAAELSLNTLSLNFLNQKVYLGGSMEMDGEKEEAKVYLTLSQIVDLIQQATGGLGDKEVMPDKRAAEPTIQLPTAKDIDEALKQLEAQLPHTKLEINSVDGDKFTIRLNVSLKDVLDLTGAPEEITGKLTNDITFALDFGFELSSGRLCALNLEFNNKALMDFLFEAGAFAYVEGAVQAEAEINVKLSVNLNYGKGTVKRLTEAEKNEYVALGGPSENMPM